jgi:hypothetical protein
MTCWKKITGRQGDWNAIATYDDDSTDLLACVHDRFWREGRQYHDPWNGADLRNTEKFKKHIELMRSKKRVIMTQNEMDLRRTHGPGAMKRTGYRGIFNIENFSFDDDGIRVTINGGIPQCRQGGKQ